MEGITTPSKRAGESHGAADALLRDAFDRRARFSPGFSGFSARARFGLEASLRDAFVEVRGPGVVEAELLEPGTLDDALEADRLWLVQELRAISRIGWAHDYDAGEGRFAKSLVSEPHDLGPLIVLHDDPHEATFRVFDGRVTMMTRRQGAVLETVRVDRWHDLGDNGVLPARWTVQFWDESLPKPLRTDRHWDLYKPLGGEMMPLLRRVESTAGNDTIVRLVVLSDWCVDGALLDVA